MNYFDTNTDGRRTFELPGARPHYNPDRPGQVEHIFLDLDFDIPKKSYHGTCTITINPVRSGIDCLILDAVSLYIDTVTIANTDQPFDYDGEKLKISLTESTVVGNKMKVEIAYHVAQPQRGIYFITPDSDYPKKPVQVWTQGEDEDSRFWFPCFDYPGQLASSEIRVRIPRNFVAVSNGELRSTEEEDQTKIYHWYQEEVHPTYLMTLAIGDFAEIRDEWRDKPVLYFVDKGREEDARRTMGKTPRMIEFFSKAYGYPYAYPKYAQICVEDFIFGGMENTSTTLLTDRCLIDERASLDNQNSESLVAHELAHQWFGDLVVIKHWSHAWVKEGMASYAEVMWTEHEYSSDDAAYYRLNEARSYLNEDTSRYRRPMVTHVYREAIELYDRHIYEKGACVYHMIRAELGSELFERAIHTFVQDHAHQTVETIDLLRAIEKATGRNLQFLFDQYVFRGGYPDYKVSYSWDGDSNLAKVIVVQTQAKDDSKNNSNDLFDLKVPIGFGFVDEENDSIECSTNSVEVKSFTVRIHEREQSFYFPLEKKPRFICFDVQNHFLKKVTLDYPVTELKAQLQYDPDPISRIYAVEALAKKDNLEVISVLSHALQHDSFWGVRAEVAENIASVKLDQVFEELLKGLDDPDARVRRAAVKSLAKIKTRASYKSLKAIAEDGDASYYVEAAAIKGLGVLASSHLKHGNGKEEKKSIKLFKAILDERAGWNEVVRSGAIAGLSELKTSQEALELILEYTILGIPQPLRLAAIRALGKISLGQSRAQVERILTRLDDLSSETFFLTQVAVVSALGQMETTGAIAILQALSAQSPDGRVRRRAEEAIQKVRKSVDKDESVKMLQNELDQVKQENQELRSRLETLEAKVQLKN